MSGGPLAQGPPAETVEGPPGGPTKADAAHVGAQEKSDRCHKRKKNKLIGHCQLSGQALYETADGEETVFQFKD